MASKSLVTIYTQVYNTKQFLPKCIDSVLNQTYPHFEYVLIDNGSTDGCKELLEAYAIRDQRIRLVRFEENRRAPIWVQIAKETATTPYVVNLDSDDWLEETFLEKLLDLAKYEQVDIVCTGTAFHVEGQAEAVAGVRNLPQRITVKKFQFSSFFPYYHVFFRAMWAKLLRSDLLRQADYSRVNRENLVNGSDTLNCFAWLRQANRICVDNSVLHHYLMRKKSVYSTYHPKRFTSNVVLYQDAVDFLSQFGHIVPENRKFLACVYANSVLDTLEVLSASTLSASDKLREYCAIAAHPVTRENFRQTDESIECCRNKLLQGILNTSAQPAQLDLPLATQVLLPKCGAAVTEENLLLFQTNPDLKATLVRDDVDELAGKILDLIEAKRFIKQYDLGNLMRTLAAENLLLCNVDDVQFMRKYRSIYWAIWQGNTLDALDEMTGLLLEGRVNGAEETFLQLYVSAAAMTEQASAFIFGKIKLASFYLRHQKAEECRTVLDELEEMGIQDNETMSLRKKMKELES